MTATFSVARMQSSRERRLPLNTSTCAAPQISLDNDWSLAVERDGLTKQRRLQKPRSRSRSTTLSPMKPAAPVTRIRSRLSMMKLFSLCSMWNGYRTGWVSGSSVLQPRLRPEDHYRRSPRNFVSAFLKNVEFRFHDAEHGGRPLLVLAVGAL